MNSYKKDDETRPYEAPRSNPIKANDLEAIEIADEALINKNSRALDKIEANFDRQRRNRKRRAAQLQEEIEDLKEKTRRLELGFPLGQSSTKTTKTLTPRESLLAAEKELLREQQAKSPSVTPPSLIDLVSSLADDSETNSRFDSTFASAKVADTVASTANKTSYLEKLSATMEQEIKEIRDEISLLKKVGPAPVASASSAPSVLITPIVDKAPTSTLGAQTVVAVPMPAAPIVKIEPVILPKPVEVKVQPLAEVSPSTTALVKAEVEAATSTALEVTPEVKPAEPVLDASAAALRAIAVKNLSTPIIEELKAQDGLTSVISTKEANYVPGQFSGFSEGQRKWAEKLVKQFDDRLKHLDKWDAKLDDLVSEAAEKADKKNVAKELTTRFQTESVRNVQAFRALLGSANETRGQLDLALTEGNAVVFGEKLTKLNSQTIDLSSRYTQVIEAIAEIGEKDKTRYGLRVARRVTEARKRNADLINMMMFYIKHISPILERARVDEQTRTMELSTEASVAAPRKSKSAKKPAVNWEAKSSELSRLVYAWDNLKQRFNTSQVALRNAIDHTDHKRYLKAQQELSRYENLTADFWDHRRWNEIAHELRALGVKGVVRKVDTKTWLWLLIGAAGAAIAGATLGGAWRSGHF